MIFNELI